VRHAVSWDSAGTVQFRYQTAHTDFGMTEANNEHMPPEAAKCKFLATAPTKISAPPAQASGAISKIVCDERAKMGAIATYLLELLDGTLVDTAALVDQVCDAVSPLQ
jgi:hypothetical protein